MAQGRASRRRVALVAVLIALLTAVLLASGVASTGSTTRVRARKQRLDGATFTSALDARWSIVTRRGSSGFESFALSSGAGGLDAEGIPAAGAIGITVSESLASARTRHALEAASAQAASAAQARLPEPGSAQAPEDRAGQQALALLSAIVRTPKGAQGVELTDPPHVRSLAGAVAAEEAYEYLYEGHGNVQVDVVARRGEHIYFAELDTELARLGAGEDAFAQLLAGWRFL